MCAQIALEKKSYLKSNAVLLAKSQCCQYDTGIRVWYLSEIINISRRPAFLPRSNWTKLGILYAEPVYMAQVIICLKANRRIADAQTRAVLSRWAMCFTSCRLGARSRILVARGTASCWQRNQASCRRNCRLIVVLPRCAVILTASRAAPNS